MKREELMRQFDGAKRKAIDEGMINDPATIAKLERDLSKCCMQSSRLYVQIIQFLDEANFFKGQQGVLVQ